MHELQKASMWKRISAALLDFIILFVVNEGIMLLLATVLGYPSYIDERNALEEKYILEYGIDRDMTEEELNALSEAEQDAYKAKVEAANEAYQSDPRVAEVFGKIISLSLMIATLSILLAFLILEFAVPLILKNGQTLGKRIFGVAVVRIDAVRVTPVAVFARSILGKCTICTLVPIYLILMVFFGILGTVGLVAFGGVLLLQAAMFFTSRYHTPIHDKLAQTVAVDMSTQMIFDSAEDLVAYRKRLAAEEAEKREW